jgi:acetyl-CoA carboxylase carboxyltransferase component
VDGVAFYHLILGRKKAGDLFQISCLVCRCVGGGYLVVKVRGKLTQCEADKQELIGTIDLLLAFHLCQAKG